MKLLVLGLSVVSLTASGQESRQGTELVSFAELRRQLVSTASPKQLATMRKFAAQHNAPKAIGKLLRLLRDKAPRLDNNVCLVVEWILAKHPDAECDPEPLLEAVARKIWNSQQKAAQALYHVIEPNTKDDRLQRFARALIPLTTSQRSRVFQAAARCLRKLSGQKHGPDPAKWSAWFEERFGEKLDLSDAVYELVAVVRRAESSGGVAYTVNGESVGDAAALREHLAALHVKSKARGLQLTGVLQISDDAMKKMVKTFDLEAVQGTLQVFLRLGIPATVSPASDVFRAPWKRGS